MDRKKRHLIYDTLFLIVSIAFAFYIFETGLAHYFVASLGKLELLGVVFAGLFFTSIFTTAPAIVLLGQFASDVPLPILVVLGGFGAMVGDYILFRIVRDRVRVDFEYLLSLAKIKRFPKIFKTKLFHFFVPLVGAFIIASPLPDEIGITMLGLSKIKSNIFYLISFIFNGIGILIIGLLAKSLI